MTNYPEWQQKMREAQAKRDAEKAKKDAEREKAEAEREQERLDNIWAHAVKNFNAIGFAAYPATRPDIVKEGYLSVLSWMVDDYRFQVSHSALYVYRDLPQERPDELGDWRLDGWKENVWVKLDWRDFNAAAIADLFDAVDGRYEIAIHSNHVAIEEALQRKAAWERKEAEREAAPSTPKQPTFAEQLRMELEQVVLDILADNGLI